MRQVPMLRVRYAKAFATALQASGYDADALLCRVGLDVHVLEMPEAWVPISQLCRFLEVAVEETGYITLGLDAGSLPREQHSQFSKLVLYAPTLYQSLRAVCQNSASEDTSARFRLVRDSTYGWMNCGPLVPYGEGTRQIELYRYAAILGIIRSAAGPEWLPRLLTLQSEHDSSLANSRLLRGTEVQFGQRGLAIAIQPQLLSRPMFDVPDVPSQKARFANSPLEFGDILREVVRTQMLANKSRINDTSEVLGISPRTLQRRLAEHELSFSRLLQNVRVDTAKQWLEDENNSLSTIAHDLGYRRATHFSRAFRRVCGISPGEYRRLQRT